MSEEYLGDIFARVELQVSDNMGYQIEQQIKVFINDKPKKMTQKNWEKICRQVVTLKYLPQKFTQIGKGEL